MRLGEGVEWALHSCVILAVLPRGQALPAAKLAEFHDVPAAYLANQLQALSQAGIAESVPGRRATEIRLLEIVDAVEGGTGSFRCTEIRRRGPSAAPACEYRGPCSITVAMRRADEAWRAELARQTLASLLGEVAVSISPVVATKAAAWMQEVAR